MPPGDPYHPHQGCRTAAAPAVSIDHEQSTNHLVTSDRWGNVVSYTNTIEQIAGTGMTVPGYGFLLNNEMTDFDFTPIDPPRPDPNLPAAGKRPRSSMSPTIVLRNGKPVFAVGSPGGSTIITTVLQILVNHIDFGMSLEQAIAAPRVGNSNSPTSYAEPAFLHTRVARLLHRRHGQEFTEVTGPAADRQPDRRRDRRPDPGEGPLPCRRRAASPRRRVSPGRPACSVRRQRLQGWCRR